MPLTLTLRAAPSVPLEIDNLLPEALAGKSSGEIEQLQVLYGNSRVALAELFTVQGDANDLILELVGNLAGVHRIGARMARGRIHVHGDAGRHAASELAGGEIVIEGNAGDWLAAEMHGGLVRVRGSAANHAGAAYAGSPRGMTGGTVLVHGAAGNQVGTSMRRGLIAIGQTAGDFVGARMWAGTILVGASAGHYPGREMNRGTIAIFGDRRPRLLPSFERGITFHPPMLRVLLRHVRRLKFPFDSALDERAMELHHGDMLALGRGDILLPVE
jgi:formylmethanofuran dehydrogenase subunit C